MNDEQMVDRLLAATGGDIGDEDERAFAARIVSKKIAVASILQGLNPPYPACDDAEQAAFAHRTSE